MNNAYAFNHLYQMINQTVTKGGTTLQNLSYNFSSAQNNGQILSQTDAISGETVEYTYDALNRLATAATVDTSWGLEYTYDGFGNRTNQTLTKGSGPTHSVAIDATTNRINSAGYGYDANGNMTQMPLMTMTYDVANRMVTSNHSSAGNQVYGYNHANQRVFVRNGNTVTYHLYGMGGERLMEFQETCTGGACTSYTENQRWIYFAGRKMFSKTGSTLKAITPNRLASEANHYPYGETQGTPPADTKDYFATYRRDDTGLDYAMNRYYSPTMGRFTTADPYDKSIDPRSPQTWNRYTYSRSDPTNTTDPSGLQEYLVGRFGTCDLFDPGELEFMGGLISETGIVGCPWWARPDPSYRQQRFVPGNVNVAAIGDGVYYIMHQTQASGTTELTFTIETILVASGSSTTIAIGKAVPPAVLIGGLLYVGYLEVIWIRDQIRDAQRRKSREKQRTWDSCQRLYAICRVGNCGRCLSYCLTQDGEWPFDDCPINLPEPSRGPSSGRGWIMSEPASILPY